MYQDPQQQQQQQQYGAEADANPLGIETVPGLRWTFSVCPNATSNAAGGAAGGAAAGGASSSGGAKTAGGVLSAITGVGSASAADCTAPPPLPEMVIPLAVMYTPMFDHVVATADEATGEQLLQGCLPRVVGPLGRAPPQCKTCRTFLNKHIAIDPQTRVWACPCCFARNQLGDADAAALAQYSGDFGGHPLMQYATVEYVLSGAQPMTPVFLFVIDTCVDREELEAMRLQLLRAVEWLPPDARVGFLTFGHNVTLWELGCDTDAGLQRCYSFRGCRRYSKAELQAMLGLPRTTTTTTASTAASDNTKQAAAAAAGRATPSSPLAGGASSNSGGGGGTNSMSPFRGAVQDRFLCALSDCELTLSTIIEHSLCGDPFAVPVGHRPLRATGAALEIAVALLELVADSHFGKVLLFCGGPCTRGPGCVAEPRRSVLMRGHKDLQEGNAPLFEPATAFYRELELRLTRTTSSLDCFIFSLDQVGLLELRSCVNSTGGLMVMGDKFQNKMFAESLRRFFERSCFAREPSSADALAESVAAGGGGDTLWTRGHNSGFGLEVRVSTSPETKVMGCLGHCRAAVEHLNQSQQQQHGALNNVSPHRIGVGGTNRWLTASADSSLTLCVVFDTEGPAASGRKRFVQIVTRYYATNGEHRARVTSVAMPMPPAGAGKAASVQYVQQYRGFDQECAAVVVARMAVSLMEQGEVAHGARFETIRRWIDRMLVMYVRTFGSYAAGNADSVRLPQGYSLFPAFMFHFRRSEFFLTLNISPDETTFKRHFLMREPCDNCTIMVQPVLYSYTLDEPFAQPVPLDTNSIRADNILLIDGFFDCRLLYGVTVEEWAAAGYQDQPDMEHFKTLLEVPARDVDAILATRMPYPWHSVTGRWGGDARHFLNRLSAGGPAAGGPGGANASKKTSGDGGAIFTEDASMSRFMQSLKNAVVMAEDK